RVDLMLRLALSGFHSGRSADSLRWASEAIRLDPKGYFNVVARRVAALAAADLGKLDDAEQYAAQALSRAPHPHARADALALLASYALRRGDLDKAERIAREAELLAPGSKPMPWLVIAQTMAHRGHIAQSIQTREHAYSINEGHGAA